MNEWISVRERLPNDYSSLVIATLKTDIGNFVTTNAQYILSKWVAWNEDLETYEDIEALGVKVVAWMDYPEPYEEN